MQPSLTDLETPFDPTSYLTISGAQLEQLVGGTSPFTDKGLFMITTDVGGNPQVPNAVTVTKWQVNGWIRVSATLVTLYLWNPNGASDATYLQWQSLNTIGIGAGSIVNSMIADNTITDVKIASVDYSKITNAPTGLPPSGAASGDLTGTYPSPSVAAFAITSAKIAALTIVQANVANQGLTNVALAGDNAAGDMLRAGVIGAATTTEWFAPPKVLMATGATLETGLATNQLKNLQVNAAGNGYQFAGASTSVIQLAQFISTGAFSTTKAIAPTGTAPTLSNTDAVTILGVAGSMAFTPLSASSKLKIDVSLQITSNTSAVAFAVLFLGTVAKVAGLGNIQNGFATPSYGSLQFSFIMNSPGASAQTFVLGLASDSEYAGATLQLNEKAGTTLLGGGLVNSSVTITEII